MGVAAALILATLPTLFLPTSASAVQTPQTRVVSDDPVNWTPHVLDGRVMAIVQVGDLIVLSGEFTQVSSADGNTIYDRSNIVAFSASTGAVSTTFAPSADGEVAALAVAADGRSVYAGGFFDTIGGRPAKSLARIDIANGQLTSGFTIPTLDGRVKDLRLAGGRLWLAGTFVYVAGHRQPGLATINPATGAFDSFNRLVFAGPQNGGVMQIMKIDVTPDASRLVAIGNFTLVGDQRRVQIAMLNLSGTQASVANWQTEFYSATCSASFDSYMRDIDIAPDGSYFVVTTTGAYKAPPAPCDTVSRFETGTQGTGITPTWTSYTGGDTFYAVAATGTAVYVGGHFRWHNNPTGRDAAGPGAVGREGIATLDPENGLPLRWNPGRTKGVGVFDMVATSQGLWVGSDTDRIGNWEYHARIAFFPLAGGTTVPHPRVGALPANVYSVPSASGTTHPVVRHVDGSSSGSTTDVPGGGITWSGVRGGFMLGDELYAGWSNGDFTRRTFDGTSYGAPVTIETGDLISRDTAWHQDVAAATGMFWSGGRLYYTRSGSSALYYRTFTVESDVVGAQRFTASNNVPGVDFSRIAGMFVSGGWLYFGTSSDGNLRRIQFADGSPAGGTVQIVSGPTVDGNDWRSRAMFLDTHSVPPNQPPVASASVDCQFLTCTFSAADSRDPDGSIASYAWNFGDGTADTDATVTHTFAAAGHYVVRLTVTDNQGATAGTNADVTVTAPPVTVRFVGQAGANANVQNHQVTIPSTVQAGDRLLLLFSINTTTPTISAPTGVTGWTGVAARNTSSMVSRAWQKSAAASDAGRTVTVPLSGYAKGDLTVVAYRGPNIAVSAFAGVAETTARTTHTAPTVSLSPPATSATWLVSYWGEKSSATTALTPPAGQNVRRSASGIGGGRITALLTDAGVASGAASAGGLTATANSSSAHATMWSFVVGAHS
ncbi:PKD domain-containing protein [Actinopolymorpha pittospori]|uniref:PKD domain-containing protein n=1 Tax=Actinopolymorpha pittospori TaxID=648752 RepID=A0A927N6N1_9ACTN|nr:PKD domain-containing protein [Actinopolymorpha pittospori]MBE1611963.1 hypothetical protein [Actinopolymorpha pittospori]